MRTIEQTGQFKRDLKREAKGAHRTTLQREFVALVAMLARDEALPQRHRDHALTGDWKDHRDCHIKPDLVLIYHKPDGDILRLVRLGSHSELGLWGFENSRPKASAGIGVSSVAGFWQRL
jgi:mRNA interferase YafQ